MTISNTPNKSGPYFTDGVTTSFPFEFKAFDATDIAVYRAVNGVGTLLAYPADYAVAGLNNDAGGTITTTTTYPDDGGQIDIVPATPFVQPTSLPNQGAYYAKTVERAIDRVVMMIKRLSEQMDRALRLPVGSAIDGEDAIAELLASVAAAEAAATLAERWASDPVDAAVTPGKYSSYHWAYKAALSAVAAATFDPAAYVAKVQLGVGANKVLQLDAAAKIPVVDGSNLTSVNAATLGGASLGNAANGVPQLNANALLPKQILRSGMERGWAYAAMTANTALTAQIPDDDTPPLSSEGTQILSVTLNVEDAGSLIYVDACVIFGTAGSHITAAVAALFDGTVLKNVATKRIYDYGHSTILNLTTVYAAETAGTHTITLRIGPTSGQGGTIYLNSCPTGVRRYGADNTKTTLIAREVTP